MNGTHVSIAGGFQNAKHLASELGCTAAQVFLHGRNEYFRKEWPSIAEIAETREFYPEMSVVVHACYYITVCRPVDDAKAKVSVSSLAKDMQLAEVLGFKSVVFHPGSSKEEESMTNLVMNIRRVLDKVGDCKTQLLIENACHSSHGMPSWLGDVLRAVDDGRVGVCLDTAHAVVNGYRLWEENIAATWAQLGVKAVHFNNPTKEFGSHRDGHGRLGEGSLDSGQVTDIYWNLRSMLGNEVPFIIEATDDSGEIAWMNRTQEAVRKSLQKKTMLL